MPHSLRVRLKNLQRKGELTEKDIDRIFKALEQSPCDDAISRQYLLDNCVMDKVIMPYVPVNRIENAPSVNPVPCEDAISRQAVLKTLDDADNFLDEDGTIEHYKELLKECYEVLPPVNPQAPKTGWIPVSERLPEDGQNVLFCDIDNDIMVGYHVKGRPDTHFSQDGTYDDMKDVRAWMPLPKPYKESE